MKYWRLYLIASLLLAPVVVLVTAGAVALWRSGLYYWLWWLLPLCWGLAWVIIRRWRKRLTAEATPELEPPAHWTPRDEEAWKRVESLQESAAEIPAAQLVDPHFYLQSAMDLALQIARYYHPKAKDPVGSLTVLEILAVAQLALQDTHQFVRDCVPGSHLLSVDQWRMLAKAPRWLSLAGNVAWAVSVVVNPLNLARYAASRLAVGSATRLLQENVLAWFFAIFAGRVGFYLIEMNSGRLRGGAERYRQLTRSPEPMPSSGDAPAPAEPEESGTAGTATVRIAVVGQVKAGKSSLINALCGRHEAAVDVLPQTRSVARYGLHCPATPDVVELLDTPGYGDDGATKDQLAELRLALQQADLVLLVMNAGSPARGVDAAVLRELLAGYDARPDRKPPPILGVLTHVDRLSPVLEWSPPYDWLGADSPKAQSIRGAVEYHRELFGDRLTGVIPVCSDRQRVYGVEQWLLPAILEVLGEARGCAVLRVLAEDASRGRVRKIFSQLVRAGAVLLEAAGRNGGCRTPSASRGS